MDFMKYHGLGNDFVMIEERETPFSESEAFALARRLCARRLGIGADGLIIVRKNPLEMVIYNSDGSRRPCAETGFAVLRIIAMSMASRLSANRIMRLGLWPG